MAFSFHCCLTVLAGFASLTQADEIGWGDVAADGSLETRSLDVPVSMARGVENFFESDPMDSHDWFRTAVVRKSLMAERKVRPSAKVAQNVAELEESLRPIFSAMPKDANGRVNNGTARYALHRLFSEKYGWSIKGMQPAGASWLSSQAVTPDVKDVTKYIVPTYIQDLVLDQLGLGAFDLHSLAVIAATLKHIIHSELLSVVFSVYTTLELPVPGKKTEKQVEELLSTFMMVYALGLNTEASVLADVQRSREYLERSHSGWPQLVAFAQDVKQSTALGKELDFDEIVQVAEKIGEGYALWQGKDCRRAKAELAGKPSHRNGKVLLSEVQPSHAIGRRSLFTETPENLEKLGALSKSDVDGQTQLVIPNYINSQSMCLSTASFYTACCVNECEGLLAKLEREVVAPTVAPADLARLMAKLPGPLIAESLLQEIASLADKSSGMVALHGRALAEWMHKAFPLECPLHDITHIQQVTNPKTPDEWIGESDLQVAELTEMMGEIAQVLAQYTTMGKKDGDNITSPDAVSDPENDIIRVIPDRQGQMHPQRSLLGTVFQLTAMASMMALVVVAAKSSLLATSSGSSKHKGLFKDLV